MIVRTLLKNSSFPQLGMSAARTQPAGQAQRKQPRERVREALQGNGERPYPALFRASRGTLLTGQDYPAAVRRAGAAIEPKDVR
jgi:hypothetical protein